MFQRVLVAVCLCITVVFGMKVDYRQWQKGMTFSGYLSERNISVASLETISEEDRKFLLEIRNGYPFYELIEKGQLLQALIPISEEMQIHLFRDGDRYRFDVIPVVYDETTYFGKISLRSNPYEDIRTALHYPLLSKRLGMALKGVIDTKKLHKGDEIDLLYSQKMRLGTAYGVPRIKVVRLHTGSKEQFVYVDDDGYGYDDTAKKVAYTVMGKKKVIYTRRVQNDNGSIFGMPLRHIRITSSFSYRRWHPILHRYRPHHGTDFGARRGTPLLAVNDGKVIYAGWMRGYGRVVKIKHAGGYISLYAHQSRMRVKRGQYVRKGQIIGYVGSSGRSTGPHLHFGLMKKGRWIDPMKVLGKKSVGSTTILKKFTKYEDVKQTKYKKVEIKGAQQNRKALEAYLLNDTPSYIWGKERFEGKLQDAEILDDE